MGTVSRHSGAADAAHRQPRAAAPSTPRCWPRNGRLLPVEGTYCVLDAELREAIIVAHPGGREQAPKTRLMEDVLASVPEAVVIVHGDHVLYTNPAFTRMFGYTAEEVERRQPARLHRAGDAAARDAMH